MTTQNDNPHPRDAEINLRLQTPAVEPAPDYTERLLERLRENDPSLDADEAIDAWLQRKPLNPGAEYSRSLRDRLATVRQQREQMRWRRLWATLAPVGVAAAVALVYFMPTTPATQPAEDLPPENAVVVNDPARPVDVSTSTVEASSSRGEAPITEAAPKAAASALAMTPAATPPSEILSETDSIPDDIEAEINLLADGLRGIAGLTDLDNLDTLALLVP